MRKKITYKLQVPTKLTDLGFPCEFEGIRAVEKDMGRFIDANMDALISLYHPTDEERDEVGRVVDYVTWRQKCDKESRGYTYRYVADSDIGVFDKGSNLMTSQEVQVDRLSRAMDDELTNRDFLGYVPSFRKNDLTMVSNAIIRAERDRAIRNGYYFRVIKRIKGINKRSEMVEYGIRQDVIHNILDDIITGMEQLPALGPNDIWTDAREELEDLVKEVEAGEITVEEYREDEREIRRIAFDRLFSRRRTNEEIASYTDSKRTQWGTIDALKKNKITRMKMNLEEQPPKKTKYEQKAQVVKSHFYHHPDSSLRFASRETGLSVNTIKKYKAQLDGCIKVAPNVSNRGIYIDKNGATLIHPPFVAAKRLPDNRVNILSFDEEEYELIYN